MEKIDNERLILESGNRQLKLTTHRLRYYETDKSNSDFTSIMLDKISSVEVTYYQKSIWILIIGIITIPIVVGVFIIVIFFASKRHVVSITPDGGKPIIFNTRGMKREFIDEFVDEVEAASILLKGK